MTALLPKLHHLPKDTKINNQIIQDAIELGCVKTKLIRIKTIVLGNWLRVQCQFGCASYGKRLTCPPFTPMVDEVSDLLTEYENALLIEAEKPERVQEIVLTIEGNLKRKDYPKAFALGAMDCNLCQICSIESHCQYPTQARPSMRAFGIDIAATVINNGWSTSTGQDFCQNIPIGLVLID